MWRTTFEVDQKYAPIKAVGKGAYGVVCSAKNAETGEKVRCFGFAGFVSRCAREECMYACTPAARGWSPKCRCGGGGARQQCKHACMQDMYVAPQLLVRVPTVHLLYPVFCCTGSPCSTQVAIKKITNAFENLVDARRTLREMKLLRELRCARGRQVVGRQQGKQGKQRRRWQQQRNAQQLRMQRQDGVVLLPSPLISAALPAATRTSSRCVTSCVPPARTTTTCTLCTSSWTQTCTRWAGQGGGGTA